MSEGLLHTADNSQRMSTKHTKQRSSDTTVAVATTMWSVSFLYGEHTQVAAVGAVAEAPRWTTETMTTMRTANDGGAVYKQIWMSVERVAVFAAVTATAATCIRNIRAYTCALSGLYIHTLMDQ